MLAHASNAEAAGASGVLLAPMSYQPLPEAQRDRVVEVITGLGLA